MIFSHRFVIPLVFASLLASTACGGETLVGGSAPPAGDDAGTSSPPHVTTGAPTSPVADDAGTSGSVDARPFSPPFTDAEVSPGTDASIPSIDAAEESSCLSSADCAPGFQCFWPVNEDICLAFNPAGTCMPVGPFCNMLSQLASGCGCDGQTVTWPLECSGIPEGFAPEGIAHVGPCADAAAPEAGTTPTPDASAPLACGANGECASGYECGYPIGDCGGPAECLPSLWFSQPCNSATVLCGCDGMTVIGGCDARAASEPTVGVGSCPGDAGI